MRKFTVLGLVMFKGPRSNAGNFFPVVFVAIVKVWPKEGKDEDHI